VYFGRRYSEFQVGQVFGDTVTVTDEHLQRGAHLIGDFNPLHVDADFARKSAFGGCILHGVLTSALMSAPFGNLVAGTALGYLEHNTRFLAPVRAGDRLTIEWRVTELIDKPQRGGGIVLAECAATNQQGLVVARATGKMLVSDAQAPA
jgi:acyl dehydratase